MGAEASIRFLFWNTFLLEVLPVSTPWGRTALHSKPGVGARAREIGHALSGSYDVIALAEVFDEHERRVIVEAWGDEQPAAAVGPVRSAVQRRLPTKDSGMFTLSALPLVRRDRRAYKVVGERKRDSDAYATKGVLLAEIDPGLAGEAGHLEIYSTHLIYGGDFLPRRDQARALTDLRIAQVRELLDFYRDTHRPENLAIVCGDFNIKARDPDFPDDPEWAGRRLQETMGEAGFDDLWLAHDGGYGYTCDLLKHGRSVCPFDPDDPEFCLETPTNPDAFGTDLLGERIDYVFVQRPQSEHAIALNDSTIRRRAFPRRPGTPGFEQLPFLSDHLALHVELSLRGRTPS